MPLAPDEIQRRLMQQQRQDAGSMERMEQAMLLSQQTAQGLQPAARSPGLAASAPALAAAGGGANLAQLQGLLPPGAAAAASGDPSQQRNDDELLLQLLLARRNREMLAGDLMRFKQDAAGLAGSPALLERELARRMESGEGGAATAPGPLFSDPQAQRNIMAQMGHPQQGALNEYPRAQQELLELSGYGRGVKRAHVERIDSSPLTGSGKKKKRNYKKKPADMPRRPLSAYNLFFSEERARILEEIDAKEKGEKKKDGDDDEDKKKDADDDKKERMPTAFERPILPSQKKRRPHRKTHGKISFQELAQMVGQRWKALDEEKRKYYKGLAEQDMKRQKLAMEEYYKKQARADVAKDAGAAAAKPVNVFEKATSSAMV